MAWTLLRASPGDLLTRIRGWEARGLPYWQERVLACSERVRTADSSGQLGRAISDRDVAQEAVRRLAK